jgi:hypothetical protein
VATGSANLLIAATRSHLEGYAKKKNRDHRSARMWLPGVGQPTGSSAFSQG